VDGPHLDHRAGGNTPWGGSGASACPMVTDICARSATRALLQRHRHDGSTGYSSDAHLQTGCGAAEDVADPAGSPERSVGTDPNDVTYPLQATAKRRPAQGGLLLPPEQRNRRPSRRNPATRTASAWARNGSARPGRAGFDFKTPGQQNGDGGRLPRSIGADDEVQGSVTGRGLLRPEDEPTTASQL